MAKRKRSTPSILVLPTGERYVLTVLKVNKKFPNGSPREMVRVPEQGTVHIEGGEEFVTAYLPEKVLKQ